MTSSQRSRLMAAVAGTLAMVVVAAATMQILGRGDQGIDVGVPVGGTTAAAPATGDPAGDDPATDPLLLEAPAAHRTVSIEGPPASVAPAQPTEPSASTESAAASQQPASQQPAAPAANAAPPKLPVTSSAAAARAAGPNAGPAAMTTSSVAPSTEPPATAASLSAPPATTPPASAVPTSAPAATAALSTAAPSTAPPSTAAPSTVPPSTVPPSTVAQPPPRPAAPAPTAPPSTSPPQTAPAPAPAGLSGVEREILRLTNELRTNPTGPEARRKSQPSCVATDGAGRPRSLSALSVNEAVSIQLARDWSAKMDRANTMSHRPGSEQQAIYGQLGISVRAWGENVAWFSGYSDDRAARVFFEGWRESDGHYCNMMSSGFTHIGIGVHKGASRSWATQNFYATR